MSGIDIRYADDTTLVSAVFEKIANSNFRARKRLS